MNNDIHYKSIREIKKLLETRKLGCLELVDHQIDRIYKHDRMINSVVWLDFNKARELAKQFDGWGPTKYISDYQFTIPVTIKESFHIKDTPTTLGRTKYIPNKTDWYVNMMLDESRMIFLGKTNVSVDL